MFVFLLFLILFLVIPVSAQDRRGMTQPYGYIDLTSDQLTKIQELELAFQKDIFPLRTKLMTGYMELDNLHIQYADQKKIEIKLNELDRMESELDKKYMVYQQQIRSLLTDEQKVMFDRSGGLDMGAGRFGGLGGEYGRGQGMRYGQAGGLVGEYGRGLGMRYGQAGGLGMRYGRGVGINSGFGRNWGRGRGPTSGWNRSLGYNRGFGRSWERGFGRGYRCPFFRGWRFR